MTRMIPKGHSSTLTERETLLHWAISECLSPRWQNRYASAVTGDERIILNRTDAALSLPESLQDRLLAVLHHDRGGLIDAYITPASRFTLTRLPLADLGDILIMREMGIEPPIPLTRYKDMPAIENYALDPHHWVAPLLSSDISLWKSYPILGFDMTERRYALIDGFARATALLTLFQQGRIHGSLRVIYAESG